MTSSISLVNNFKLPPLVKLSSIFFEKIWGWEKWHLSCLPGKSSWVSNQDGEKKNLRDYLKTNGFSKDAIRDFPLLLKTINANEKLSIQVHPNDEMAKSQKSLGKSECWYILSAKKNSFIYFNFKKKISEEEIKKQIEQKKLEENLNKIKVAAGNLIYIPAGTTHAIGPGITLLEVQQSSDITYRLYDYNRKRKLHLKDGLKAIDYTQMTAKKIRKKFSRFTCPYFFLEKATLLPGKKRKKKLKEKFTAFFMLAGEAHFSLSQANEVAEKFKKTEWGLFTYQEKMNELIIVNRQKKVAEVIFIYPKSFKN